jgi:3-dehydroquinate dehydratase-2
VRRIIVELLIINGPNLNLLGYRDDKIYGKESLEDINTLIKKQYPGDKIEFFQSNHEGEIVDKIQAVREIVQGIIINPGALAHYSYAIRDAIEVCRIPVIEVHISNIYKREKFRHQSVTAPVCSGIISGLGKYSYIIAIEALKNI